MRKLSLEEIKRRKNGLDVWQDIERYAVLGYEAIAPEDLELFRWYGLHEQRPRRGYFMLRVRVPGGQLMASQARVAAQAAREFGRGSLDLTTRQDLQLHWVTIKQAPEIVRRLHEVGLSTTAAGGDTVRNTVQCPLAGRLPGALLDSRPLVAGLDRRLARDRRFANLPRKLKLAVCACPQQCELPPLHDLALHAADDQGFNLLVGGGLSGKPRLAAPLDVYLPQEHAADACEALVRLYAARGPRRSRAQARLRHLLSELPLPELRAALEEELGFALPRERPAPLARELCREHLEPGEQQDGRRYLPLAISAGRLSAEDLFVAASAAESFGSGAIGLTPYQNLILPDIPVEKLPAAVERLSLAPHGRLGGATLRSTMVVCTGSEFCELALAETKQLAVELLDTLEQGGVAPPAPLKIGISGCPNDCGQAQLSDIGLIGIKGRSEDSWGDTFELLIGPELEAASPTAWRFQERLPAEQVGRAIADLVRLFSQHRLPGEPFPAFARRHCRGGTDYSI